MGKHFFVNGHRNINPDDRSWITTAIVFHSIFDRVKEFFKPHELACQEKCYEDTGIDGIDLSDVDKECFNIFCLRCKDALAHFPDEKWMEYERMRETRAKQEGTPFLGGSHVYNGVIYEWQEILKRLELDKRYDPTWIEGYRRSDGHDAEDAAATD
jgi:hypothetical protein